MHSRCGLPDNFYALLCCNDRSDECNTALRFTSHYQYDYADRNNDPEKCGTLLKLRRRRNYLQERVMDSIHFKNTVLVIAVRETGHQI